MYRLISYFSVCFCGISSDAGGIGGVDKRVAWAVELVANLKVLGRDGGVRIRHYNHFNFSLLSDLATIDERHARWRLFVVHLRPCHRYSIELQCDHNAFNIALEGGLHGEVEHRVALNAKFVNEQFS